MNEQISIEKIDAKRLEGFKAPYVKCIQAGNKTEFICLAKSPKPFPVRKLNKDSYVRVDTGEVFEYKHIKNRSQSIQSVRKSITNLRRLINTNCKDVEKVRFATLTYAENMTDSGRLYRDFKNFWGRFCYWCKKKNIAKPEYIAVAEPQGRGAWHMHVIIIFKEAAPFIDNDTEFAPLWGHGFTTFREIKNCDNLGAYFCAEVTDMPLEDFQQSDIAHNGNIFEVKERGGSKEGTGGKTKKKFVKGARLYLYPPGMNLYRCSRGVLKPTVTKMSNSEYQKKKASAGTLTFASAYNIVSDNGDKSEIINTISHEYYNKKPQKSQSKQTKKKSQVTC